jgi:hypothetical protein
MKILSHKIFASYLQPEYTRIVEVVVKENWWSRRKSFRVASVEGLYNLYYYEDGTRVQDPLHRLIDEVLAQDLERRMNARRAEKIRKAMGG